MKLLYFFVKIIFILGLFSIFVGVYFTREKEINTILYVNGINRDKVTLNVKNAYYREYDFDFVQNVTNLFPSNINDIINIYYTIINSGNTEFTFYCPKEYTNCLTDIQDIANDQNLLSDINNFVHPYNSFSNIDTEYDTLGKVTIRTTKNYTEEDINLINSKIDELYETLVNDNLSKQENINNIHNYIINSARYDSLRSEKNIVNYRSHIAYGPLFEGYAICGGYTDLMQLFLEKLNVKNYRISSNNHIWNALEIDNKWYHLDLTWDDPVSSDGKDYLYHNYFLIDTNKLLIQEINEHQFNQEVYSELKEA